MDLRIAVLGSFAVANGDTALGVPGARLQALVTRLALEGGRVVGQSALVEAIWAADPPADPAHALQALASRLRRTLGETEAITQLAGGYRIAVDPAGVDALRFERLAADGHERLRSGEVPAAAAVLGEAAALWGEHPGTEPAVVAVVAPAAATRLAGLSLQVVTDLAAAELALGQADAATTRLHALLTEHPVHEQATALLMDALTAQGREADALARYERIRETLAEELGTDPGAALRERHLNLLRAESPGPGTAPPQPGNLPAPLTSFIGREADLARLDTLLRAGRLVTVLGPGGAGKTRLAVEAARRHREEYRDGAWMIDLSSVTEPAKLGAALLAGIGLRGTVFEAGDRTDGDEHSALVDRLGGRESLLLLDNCEHLIEPAAHLVAALLSRCPELRVLATSREPLAVDGEALVPLGPLALPGPEDGVAQAGNTAAVRLFTERAAAVRPGFAVDEATLPEIRQVVRGLDGLPLALELAAARLRTLSLPELAAGLADRFRLLTTGNRTALPRHRTLRGVLAWSWDLLGEHERTLAERIAILPGGVTPESAAAVCADTAVPPAEIPELLSGLVDRSLLQLAEPGRYRMLETVREYGTEQLAAAGDRGTADDLAADHFAALLAEYDPALRGPGQLGAIRVIGAEYDNVLAAIRRRCATGDATGALAIAMDLTWYWHILDRHTDAAHLLGEVLAVPGAAPSPDRDCAEVICLFNRTSTAGTADGDTERLAELAGRLAGYPELPNPHGVLIAVPFALLHEARAALAILDRYAESADTWRSGLARMFRSEFAENAGELDRVRADLEAALANFRQAGDRWGQSSVLPMRAQLRQYDDLDGALADLREARELSAEFGTLSLGDEVLTDLRWIDLYLRRGDTARTIAVIESARERAQRVRAPGMSALVDVWEASFRVQHGEPERARELLADADRKLRGDATFPGNHARTFAGNVRASLCMAAGDPAGAEQALAQAYAVGLETRDLPILSRVAVNTAALAGELGRWRPAARLLGAAARLRGAHDHTDRQVRELGDRAESALGTETFAAAYDSGWQLDGTTAVTAIDPARLDIP
ncbi:BTAD domain-containing putative transcriptional regulator [Sciscionella sediminilitoris]|uniref:BTAD domain-containing putative transcriptional regulator n=1 Tax=Sciscionella sediminilitoris TaxID=1445613 RepID=UPI0004DF577D|nr:BTAD domain-containing putative transcriptional regulator [Sciscionella sp. SE31]